ncbi:ThiF family adenylyltransferase [Billgrantia sp. Q4P2]|uniref:ThiF family adenylyltransferase n=1 Tax=Billgrantia sp. Q4P2 TaxID=3463857 RepID=UPI004056BE64
MDQFDRNILFSRMIGLVSQPELDALAGKRVAVPGCGGTGFTYAECLARMGVGGINIADADTFGPENMNRQFGCTVDTIGLKKSQVLSERLKAINPAIDVQVVDFLTEDNVDEYLEGVDVVCDTLDFFVATPRRLLYKAARAKGITVIICCPVAFGVTAHVFEHDGITFESFFGINDAQSETEQLVRFGQGLTPSSLFKAYTESPSLDFEAKSVASLSASCLMATSFGSMLALMKLLNIEPGLKPAPYSYEFDLRAGAFKENLTEASAGEAGATESSGYAASVGSA